MMDQFAFSAQSGAHAGLFCSLCTRSPPHRQADDLGNLWAGSLMALSILCTVRASGAAGNKKFISYLQSTSRLFKNPRNSWNQSATQAIGSELLLRPH
jgi:hypothetical protein